MRNSSLCVAAGIFVGSLAVSSMAGEVYAGFKGGLGLNSFIGKDAKDMGEFPDALNLPMSLSKSMKVGFCVGGFVNYKIVDMVGIEGGLLYNVKGQNYDFSETVSQGGYSIKVSGSANIKGSYLDIPVLLKLYIPTAALVKPVIYAGPSFNINLTSEIQAEMKASVMGQSIYSQDTTMDFKDNTNGFEMGIIMGGGMEIPLVSGSLIFQAHYFLGLTKLAKLTEEQKDAGATDSDLPDIKNSQIAVTVGYGFRL